jgi:hypothetical protein
MNFFKCQKHSLCYRCVSAAILALSMNTCPGGRGPMLAPLLKTCSPARGGGRSLKRAAADTGTPGMHPGPGQLLATSVTGRTLARATPRSHHHQTGVAKRSGHLIQVKTL